VIWECVQCRERVQGPQYPATSHRCRICPTCTLRFGRTVYRRRRERRGRVAKANPRLGRLWHGIDMPKELRRLLRFCPPHVTENPPSLRLRYTTNNRPGLVAQADLNDRWIEILVWPLCPPGWAVASLVHELAHFVSQDTGHGDGFRTAVGELVRDGYGMEVPWTAARDIQSFDQAVEDTLDSWYRSRHGDDFLSRTFRAWLEQHQSQGDPS